MEIFSSYRSRAIRIGRTFSACQRGATAVEYGLLVALISVALMLTLATVGTGIRTMLFDQVVAALTF